MAESTAWPALPLSEWKDRYATLHRPVYVFPWADDLSDPVQSGSDCGELGSG